VVGIPSLFVALRSMQGNMFENRSGVDVIWWVKCSVTADNNLRVGKFAQ
jgi:hypothetical protein